MNFDRVIQVALQAKRMGETGPLSTGEALTAALVLNRHDWLQEMDYTIAQALDRIDQDTIEHLADAARSLGVVADLGQRGSLLGTDTSDSLNALRHRGTDPRVSDDSFVALLAGLRSTIGACRPDDDDDEPEEQWMWDKLTALMALIGDAEVTHG